MVKPVFKSTRSAGNRLASYSIEVKAGKLIYQEGQLGTEMFIVQEGRVELTRQAGSTQTRLALLEQGDFFGELSILEDVPRTATARVVADCRLLRINGSTFDQMLRKNPEIGVRMMRNLSRRLRDTDRALRELIGSAAVERPAELEPAPVGEHGPERLAHGESGNDFFLSEGEETTIGRRDPVTGIDPDIDLTDVDGQRSISRRHAKIVRRSGRYFVREEIGTMNGTFVNGERIETGLPVEFKEGDEVRFGLVSCVFHAS